MFASLVRAFRSSRRDRARPVSLWSVVGISLLLLPMAARAQDGGSYFEENAAPHISQCLGCHQAGGVADSSGARLILSGAGANQSANNYVAFESYLAFSDVDAALLLAKISGGAGHGGGSVLAKGSAGYKALADLASFIQDGVASGGEGDADFWRGLVLEPRERTLRRAWILMRGALPLPGQVNAAKKSDANLRNAVLKAMQGQEFHDFLITGANDRLHTLAFNNGMFFEFAFDGTYPEANIVLDLKSCDEVWSSDDPYLQNATFHECNFWDVTRRFGLFREPLELIAHVVEKNKSYKQVLTANYTVANRYMNHMYKGGNSFPPISPDMQLSRDDILIFKRSVDKGQPNFMDEFYGECDPVCRVIDYGRLHRRPHAGILTTPAFLSRYPSTDTNRNRARARWTFYHFLGVDIEKSAPRSTDPEALADTNNPTMNNPACTVCHERLDPVAGAYQNFDDFGGFKSQGDNSLSETYKFPEWFGGEPGDTLYQDGDTWYRDMRHPGINGKKTFKKSGSVQWLAQQIVNDPRFAKATVAFWWPAIMGSEMLEQPTEESDPNYQQQLNAYNAQQALMDELAQKFRSKGFRAKQLFADMVLSDWFRAEGFEVEDGENRDVELAGIGAGRLLTPEQLDRKNFALFGARWNENNVDGGVEPWRQFTASEYLAYGGIDSFAVLERPRAHTALMSNVAERMALEYRE